jgi:hypothetical protein
MKTKRLKSFFYNPECDKFMLWLFVLDFLITGGDIKTVCKDLCIIFCLGLILKICCIMFRKYYTLPIENEYNVKSIAKKKLIFFVQLFILSGLAYYMTYQLAKSIVWDYPNYDFYKQMFIAVLWGVFSGIYFIESL